ncbi:response regulator transcription factor [Ramlibacter sp. G-1-2-2]|uniref:Response regulator transcription factor n=1 Tax=Ramlibacter agri TaxID=2728837 RepID=A0A848H4L3_9BURK|nr:response regulator transcription factor [Ramlibacter agri]NML44471.1 response regulator transcription factor [Ramlibacter agri]
MSIRVLLVDDNNLFRKGLAALISAHPDFTVVADVSTCKEAVQAALHIDPDVVVTDIALGGVNGLECVAELKRRQPHVRIILLTSLRTEGHVRAALRIGADGYLLKNATIEEVQLALRNVAMGKKYLSPDVSEHVFDTFLHPQRAQAPISRLDGLTTRERSILQLIAEGRTNKGAAEFLSVSPKTVEKHRATLMRKLGLRNAAELTMVAIELGLVERPDSLARLNPDSLSAGEPRSYRTRQPLEREPGSFDGAPLDPDIPPAYAPRCEANDG